MKRFAFLASGSGTTVSFILRAIKDRRLEGIEPALLVASEPDIGAITKARDLDLPQRGIAVVRRQDYPTEEVFGEALLALFREHRINAFGQYGWLKRTPANVLREYAGINQHPAPHWFGGRGMYGRRPHAAVLAFKELLEKLGTRIVDHTLVISQFVHAKYDQGAVLRCRQVPIEPGDTPTTLQARALPVEWDVQVETLQAFACDSAGSSSFYYAYPFVRPGEEELVARANRYALTTEA